eukprot:TRINITY_DN5013_c0_g1_i1.p1 TRINITY_DN5013_c0_g1~~TRINITY_DN5013_c0_g1_i1.p1  ORF type:complete len:170 (+),score=31.27 TRINITY_DN5013_c0_g1_i1:38-547(+)
MGTMTSRDFERLLPEELSRHFPDSVKWSRKVTVARANHQGELVRFMQCVVFLTASAVIWATEEYQFKGKLGLRNLQLAKNKENNTLVINSTSRQRSITLLFEDYDELRDCKRQLLRAIRLSKLQARLSSTLKLRSAVVFPSSSSGDNNNNSTVHLKYLLGFGAFPVSSF